MRQCLIDIDPSPRMNLQHLLHKIQCVGRRAWELTTQWCRRLVGQLSHESSSLFGRNKVKLMILKFSELFGNERELHVVMIERKDQDARL